MLLAKGVIISLAIGLAGWFLGDLFSKVTHGQPIVLDGDTLEFNDGIVDLQGIDAPEFQQTCRKGEQDFHCGAYAMAALLTEIHGKHLWCFEKGRVDAQTIVAKCYTGLTDVASRVVEDGWAVSVEGAAAPYKNDEDEARATRRGIWSSVFDHPSHWRQAMAERP